MAAHRKMNFLGGSICNFESPRSHMSMVTVAATQRNKFHITHTRAKVKRDQSNNSKSELQDFIASKQTSEFTGLNYKSRKNFLSKKQLCNGTNIIVIQMFL